MSSELPELSDAEQLVRLEEEFELVHASALCVAKEVDATVNRIIELESRDHGILRDRIYFSHLGLRISQEQQNFRLYPQLGITRGSSGNPVFGEIHPPDGCNDMLGSTIPIAAIDLPRYSDSLMIDLLPLLSTYPHLGVKDNPVSICQCYGYPLITKDQRKNDVIWPLHFFEETIGGKFDIQGPGAMENRIEGLRLFHEGLRGVESGSSSWGAVPQQK